MTSLKTSPVKDHILAIDNGTQSIRAILFDPQGDIVAKSQLIFKPYIALQPGWAEQDPDYFWEQLAAVCQQLWQHPKADKKRIAAVALTTQRGTVINVDAKGKPLRSAITWMDNRRTKAKPNLSLKWRAAFALIGLTETINYFTAEAEAVWIATHQPEIMRKTHKYLLLSGYLTYKLCGRFVDSSACQVGYIPFDYKRFSWAKASDWKWEILDELHLEHLPDLVPPGSQMGEITAEASAQTGIPTGLPLIAAAADKACESLGSGALTPDVASLSFGTTTTINTTQSRYIEPIPLVPPYPAAVPNRYSLEVSVYRGFWMVSWFKEEFAHLEKTLAAEKRIAVEALFEELIHDIPAGSLGLMLQPYWAPGLKVPGPEAKGAIIGWGDAHTRAHMYRAILEGLVYALREGGERIEKRSRQPIKSLLISGGGSQSDTAMQIAADVFGKPAVRPHLFETSALGAAIDGAVGVGLYSDFDSAVQAMTRPGKTFEPISQNHQIYDELYTRVYKKMYAKLQHFYKEIRDITGYPN
ncbi:MAG: sugar (pentulose or hexulose) kinase [Cellvibrionaceae bacterium]|jgi:sugar (pentulose or hexulose) kinase